MTSQRFSVGMLLVAIRVPERHACKEPAGSQPPLEKHLEKGVNYTCTEQHWARLAFA